MSIWDDPDLRVGGEFVKFENPGDSVSGTVTAVRAHRFDDGSVAPQVLITTDDGEERTITAGQIRLKAELATQRPEPGDHIVITHTEVEKRSGGKTLKHFSVQVTRGGKPAAVTQSTPQPAMAAATAAPAAAPGAVDPAAAAAALANLSPEQKAALGI
jgi:hypothetical protein